MDSQQVQQKSTGRKVLLAIDGSPSSNKALEWYVENMHRSGDDLILVHSAEYHVSVGLPGKAADVTALSKAVKEENDRIENMTGCHVDLLRKKNITATSKVITGMKAGEAIIGIAENVGADCIVMGSRGLGKIRRTLIGSVSDYVMHHAPNHCAVTIIRDS